MDNSPTGNDNRAHPTTTIDIWADGACIPNPGKGGYGIVIINNRDSYSYDYIKLSGGFVLTTNNRMELLAVIIGIEHIHSHVKYNPIDRVVNIYSDSDYIVRAMNHDSVERWMRKKAEKVNAKPIPNIDLWKRLLTICSLRKIVFNLVKGHSGHVHNEMADKIAGMAIKQKVLGIDHGYFVAMNNNEVVGQKTFKFN